MARLGDMLIPQTKSKIKAGTGKENGKYKFFTSSNIQNKFIDEYQYDDTALIFGTGGNASIHFCDEKFSTSTDCLVFFAKEKYILKTIYFYLSGNMNILENGFKGAGLKHISKQYILDIEIPLPPLEEQRKIAAVLDNVSDLIAKRRTQLDKLDELVKSRFIEMFGDPVTNSFNLPLSSLSQLGKFGRGVSKHRPRNAPELLGGKYPLIQTGEVANSDLYILSYQNTYSELGFKQSKIWKAGTLCITIAANIAKTAILTFDACFPDSVVGFSANDKTNNIFIHYWFGFFQQILESQAPESAQKNINLQILSDLKIIVPPIELQNQFAAFVKQTDKSKLAIQKNLEKLEILRKSLMQKYFD